MKEELTREVIEAMARCTETQDCVDKCAAYKFCNGKYWTVICSKLATALLEEMDKPKAWDGAPDNALQAQIIWFTKNGGYIGMKTYTRELPKTRIDKIVEEVIDGRLFGLRMEKSELAEMLKSALEKYAAELGTTT